MIKVIICVLYLLVIRCFWKPKIRNLFINWINHRIHISYAGFVMDKWLTGVIFPIIIVLAMDKSVVEMGFALPKRDWFDTVIIPLIALGIYSPWGYLGSWFAVEVAKEKKAIDNVKDIPEYRLSWRDSVFFPILYLFPEEGLDRGYIISQLMPTGAITAVILSSLYFGIGHGYAGRCWILMTFVYGLGLGILFLLTQSLLIPFIVHAVGNQLYVFLFGSKLRKLANLA